MRRLDAAIFLLNAQIAVASMRPKVAVIIAGHARTYDLTAKSVHENLIGLKANDHWEFTVFALAYSLRDRKRGGDKSKHTRHSDQAAAVTPENLRAQYESVLDVRIHARVIEENFIKSMLPSSLRLTRNSTFYAQRRLRVSMMFRTIAEAHRMVKAEEVASRQPFALIVKLRFDLKLLAPFKLKPEFFEGTNASQGGNHQLVVVVPTQMDHGPSHLSPRQIRTRPCNINGTDRPTWIQDHIAYGPNFAMEQYLNGTDMFMRTGARGMASPEMILAHFLGRCMVSIKCDKAIRYTIIR